MKKNFVLDTNILIHNPNCLDKFEENNIYIPYPVVEELDDLKTTSGETGYEARESVRKLMGLRNRGNLRNGVPTSGGGMLYLYIPEEINLSAIPVGWNTRKMDNLILLSALKLSKTMENVILVTNDANMTLKADVFDIKVQEYKNDRISDDRELYHGRSIRYVSDQIFDKFMIEGKFDKNEFIDTGIPNIVKNEFITVKTGSGKSYLAKYDGMFVQKLQYQKITPCGLKSRNSGQIYLQEALMTPYEKCPLTICMGPAGTGKTLYAVGCGLEQIAELCNSKNSQYKRVLVCRSNIMMDEEIGFLPGTEEDKISPLLRGVYDNLKVLIGDKEDTKYEINDKISELFTRGYIEAQAVSYLRGRSITDTYVIIDEAQNCTPNQILSIITRAGERSKIILLGDPNQIDNPRLDKRNNGLVYALERMKGSSLTQIITFDESECTRSALAKEASDKLKR